MHQYKDEQKTNFDIIVAGSYFCDMIYTGLPEVPRLGADIFSKNFDMVPGGTYYIVRILKNLGLNTGWICDFGNDFFSKYILEQSKQDGIDTSLSRFFDRPKRVVASSFSFQHDRGFVSYEDEPFQPPSFDELERLFFRAILFPGISDWKAIETVEKLTNRKNFVLFMDCQHSSETIQTPGMVSALRKLDIFAPNECEALHFTGETTIDKALDVLAEIVPCVLLKRGAKGALVRKGDLTVKVPGIKVDVMDTTGAGDSFNAGFLYGLLQNRSIEDCLRFGNITGGLSVASTGPLKCPGIQKITEMVENYPQYQMTDL